MLRFDFAVFSVGSSGQFLEDHPKGCFPLLLEVVQGQFSSFVLKIPCAVHWEKLFCRDRCAPTFEFGQQRFNVLCLER